MHTLSLTDEELKILHFSLETWINSFSHDQPDLLRVGKELRAKLDAELGEERLGGRAAASVGG